MPGTLQTSQTLGSTKRTTERVSEAVNDLLSPLTPQLTEHDNSRILTDLFSCLRTESSFIQVYIEGVTIDYLSGTSFLLCYSYRRMLLLGLCQYLEDRYVFSLGPQTFSLAPFPQDIPTPVPLLLFIS